MSCNYNGAKMREALAAYLALWDNGTMNSIDGLKQVIKQMREASSAPARNCDRFSNPHEAWCAYKQDTPDEVYFTRMALWEFIKWLFAEAKGECNGSK